MKPMTTGGIVKHLRKRAGLSQEALGEILGVKRGTVQKYESDTITLNVESIRQLCHLFDVPPWVFVYPETTVTELVLDTISDQSQKFHILNHKARTKVYDYISDLSKIESYRYEQDL